MKNLLYYIWRSCKASSKAFKNEFGQDIEIDGGMGSLTVKAINDVNDQDKLLIKIAEIRKKYYTDFDFY